MDTNKKENKKKIVKTKVISNVVIPSKVEVEKLIKKQTQDLRMVVQQNFLIICWCMLMLLGLRMCTWKLVKIQELSV